jgi:hypothetical protein
VLIAQHINRPGLPWRFEGRLADFPRGPQISGSSARIRMLCLERTSHRGVARSPIGTGGPMNIQRAAIRLAVRFPLPHCMALITILVLLF